MPIQLEVERILRVDHAGERGAINIYKAQIALSKILWPSCVPALEEMFAHEKAHFALFESELKRRGIRHCRALALWSLGGMLLGLVTALLGPRAIWTCTAAVENTVSLHLREQIEFLRRHDHAALLAVAAIEADEKSHLADALSHGGPATGPYRLLWAMIAVSTSVAIWLSHHL